MQPSTPTTQYFSNALTFESVSNRKPIPKVYPAAVHSLSSSAFRNVPLDLLGLIFQYLIKPVDRCAAAQTCRKFRELAYEPTYWQLKANELMDKLTFEISDDYKINSENELIALTPDIDFGYEDVLPDQARQRYINLVLWSAAKENRSEEKFIKFISRFSCATEFYLHRFSVLNSQVLQVLTTHVQALLVFDASPSRKKIKELAGPDLIKMAKAHPELQILSIRNCPLIRPAHLVDISQACTALRILKVDVCDERELGLNANQIKLIGSVLKELEHVSIYHSQNVDDRCFITLLQSNPKLNYVMINGCSKVTEAAFAVFWHRENFRIDISGLTPYVEEKLKQRLMIQPLGPSTKVVIDHEYLAPIIAQGLPTPEPKKKKTPYSLLAPLRRLIKGK